MPNIDHLNKTREFLVDKISQELKTKHPGIILRYTNQEVQENPNQPSVWIIDSPMTAMGSALGSNTMRYTSSVQIHALAPKSSGTKTIKEYLSTVNNFLMNYSVSIPEGYIITRGHKFSSRPVDRGGYLETLEVDYIFDSCL